ncbi:MAG: PqiC family protein [Burkholderiales bacterium]|nr:PqiC family protein [Burkholderiales bacterium]
MTERFLPLAAVALAALLALAACSTSPPPTRLHTLMPAEPTPRDPAVRAAPLFVVLEPIRLPAQVDQPQWLVRLPDESLASLEQERWASPLRDELRQALLEQLGARFGIVEGRGATPPLRVALELRRFDSVPGREARIEAAWSVVPANAGATLRCTLLVREGASGGMPELAAAHRRAAVRLAAAIGASVVALQAGSPACPA